MRRAAASGFTLLEVAVALAVLGVGIVTCLQILSGSLRLQERASRQSRCVLQARSAMDGLLLPAELSEHTEERECHGDDACCTRILVRQCGPDEGCDQKDLDLHPNDTLYYLQVDVSWQDGIGNKSYTLKSLRIAPVT